MLGTNTGVASIGFDDTLRGVDGDTGEYVEPAQPLSSQPRALDIKGDLTVTATLKVRFSLKYTYSYQPLLINGMKFCMKSKPF